MLIPWLTKDKKLLMMAYSGESLRDAKGNVIGGVFIGRNISALQMAGITATKVLNKRLEEEVGKNYELATMMFISNATLIVGEPSLKILQGVVDGYNGRFNRKIRIEKGITPVNVPKEEWSSFIEFMLNTFYECVGPTTFECAEGIRSIEDIVKKTKARYGDK